MKRQLNASSEQLQSAADSAENAIGSMKNVSAEATEEAASLMGQHAEISRSVALKLIEDIREAAEASGHQMVAALRTEAEMARETGERTLESLRASAEAVRALASETTLRFSGSFAEAEQKVDALRAKTGEINSLSKQTVEQQSREARELVEQSIALLGQTGDQIKTQFGEVAASCSDQARAIEDLLDGLTGRLKKLPSEAGEQTEAVRQTVEVTLERIASASQRAIQDASSLDANFQERLQRSYAALGELVSRLGNLTNALTPEPNVQATLPLASPLSAAAAPSSIPGVSGTLSTQATGLAPGPGRATASTDPDAGPNQTSSRDHNAAFDNDAVDLPLPAADLRGRSDDPNEDNPFDRLALNPDGSPKTASGDFQWRDILSSLSTFDPKLDKKMVAQLTGQYGLNRAIGDEELRKLRVGHVRDPKRARADMQATLGTVLSEVEAGFLSEDTNRSWAQSFTDAGKEKASRGRLEGNDLRAYCVLDAALSS